MRRVLLAGAVLVACGSSGGGSPQDASVPFTVGGGGAGGFGATGGTAATGGGNACAPNQQIACACGGTVVGYQACLPDGSGYQPCVCPDAGAGGVGGTGGCSGSQKLCNGVCQAPSPGVGCDPLGCTPCSTPPHGLAICNGSLCDFVCTTGYVKSGSSCVQLGGGGGSGGTGGSSGGTCDPKLCPTPAPPAQKCCVTVNGPCGVDYGMGAGCQVPPTGDI